MQRRRSHTVSILLGTGAKTALPGDPFRLGFIRLSRVLWLSVLVVMLGVLLEPEAAAQTVSFGAKTDFATGARSGSVAVGDFNGDGTLDLAVANPNSSQAGSGNDSATVSILLGTGSGSFGAKTDFSTGRGASSVAVGDFNGDGKLDLVVGNGILLGTGTGSFGAKTDFGTGGAVAVGDFNGDGKLDLAVWNGILLGTGTGSFGAKIDFDSDGGPVAVGDFNGDGKLDLAVANYYDATVSILLGTGTGSFGAKTDFGTGVGPGSVAVGDFNGDGKLDLAVANPGFYFGDEYLGTDPQTVSILLGAGTGSFGAKTDFATSGGPFSVAVGDFNGDGKLDLAVPNFDRNTVSILVGTATGSFGAKTDFGTGSLPYSVAVGDLNGDGKLDLAVANLGSVSVNDPGPATVSILLNTGTVPNPIDDPQFFVRQQYRDFLNREPDTPGLTFWTGEITECSNPEKRQPGESFIACTERKRANTSAAFFLSAEFQNTGSFVLRVYWGALGKLPNSQCPGVPSGLPGQCRPLYPEYVAEVSQVATGIVVNDQLDPNVINANKRAFSEQFVTKPAFKTIYDSLNSQQFVDKLFETTGINASAADRAALVNGLNGINGQPATETRSSVVFKVVDGTTTQAGGALVFNTSYGQAFYAKEFDDAFVFMEYIGYLRRNPDQGGYEHWLAKLKQYGNWQDAQMVLAFISSPEYKARFGQP